MPQNNTAPVPEILEVPRPYYFGAHYVYTFKIRSAVPKNLATPYRNFGVPCRSFCLCKWGCTLHKSFFKGQNVGIGNSFCNVVVGLLDGFFKSTV